MRNNNTTAHAPLRTSEISDVIYQQIIGAIKREGSGQFETVQQPTEDENNPGIDAGGDTGSVSV